MTASATRRSTALRTSTALVTTFSALMAASLLALPGAARAQVAPGDGARSGDSAGGQSSQTGNGDDGASSLSAAGGGGAGVNGGAGGNLLGLELVIPRGFITVVRSAGGAGGSSPGANGADGSPSGGGGGGGAHGYVGTTIPTQAVAGGRGGNGVPGIGASSGGGGGGFGAVITGSGSFGTIVSAVRGGDGGTGGSVAIRVAGGGGGHGLVFTSPLAKAVTINTVIAGGNAGDPGNGLQGTPNASGGNGIIGSNLALNLGSDANVSGGVSFLAGPAFLSPPSRPRANAIVFSGGRNQLTAAAGAVIDGDISVTGHLEFFQDTDFVLASGITGDGSIEKSGVGTLTLTGSGTNVGGTIISGGTLQIGNGGSTGSLGPGDIINDASLVFNRSNDLTVANAISGVGGLTKRGGGILTLTGLNTYLGTTTISEGTLQIGARGTEGNLGRGDVINNASLVFNRSDFVLVENSISGTGSVSMRGIGTLYLTADNSFSGGLFVRQGTVIFNPGSVGTGTISLADETTLQSGALAPLNVANDISISVTGTATFRSFTSSRVNLDGIISGGNLAKTGESLVVFRNNANSFAGLDVRLGAVGITANGGFGSGTVTLQDNTTIVARAADLNVANAIELVGTGQILTFGQTLTLSGSIAGGTLVKADPGTLVLTGTNTYSGITRVSSGTLIAGNARALGTSTLGVGGAGSVVIADFDGEFANIHRVGDGGTLAAGSGRTVGLTGILSLGNDGVAKFGLAGQNGVLVFDQFAIGFPTSAPPATSIEGGTVRIGSRVASQFATLTQSSAFTSIQSAGTLDINGNSMELGKLNGTGTILNRGAAATLTLTNSTFAGTFDSGAEGMTLAGAITGESGFTKRGSGVLTLAADLDLTGFTGGFTLAEGTLSLRGNLASTFGSIRTTGSVIDYADGVISAAPIVIDSDTTRLQALSGAATQSGVISELGGARGFEKIGAGTLTLAAANTYTGAITVAEGTLHVTNEAALGGSGGGTTVLDGATLALGNTDSFMFVNEATTIRGNGVNNSGALRGELSGARLTRAVTLAGAARIGSESGTLVIGGGISGADHDLTVGGGSLTILASPIALGSGRLIKDGSTGLWLFDTQAQISELLIKSGEVVFLSDTGTINNTIADTAAVTLEGGALNLSLSETIGSLAGGANARVSTIAPSSTLTVGANNTSTEFAGVISSGLNLTKVGTGTLTLSGANTYTGTTRIEAGTLALGADNAIPGSPFLIISGGTLALGGFSQSVMVTGFSAGGISGPGTLDVLGSYSQSGGTIGAGAIVNLLDEGLLSGGTIAGTLNHIAPFPRRFGIEGGHVTVTGTLDVERILRVADVAATEVTVTNGGTVRAGDTFIASTIGANGSVTINGAGSNWNSDAFIVGRFGTGSLAITDGGQASSGDGVLGSQSGSTGLSTIDGAGSNWTNSLALVVGGNGSGTLAITNGGRATNVNALIANGFGSTGIATITGPGSGWESTGVLLVGRRGNGTLNISEGGLVTAANASIATVAGSVGTIVFGSSQGAAPTAAGRLLAPTLEFGPGSGAIVFNHTSADFELASAISGFGALRQLAGITNLTGASGGFTGSTEITGGTLLVGGTLGGGVSVSGAGMLGGSGTLTGNVSINEGGTLAPGNSPGTLTIAGNLDLNAGSTSIFELGEAGVVGGANNDLVAVTGNLALNGGTIRIQRGAGFSGGQYTLFTYGSLTGALGNMTFDPIGGGFVGNLALGNGTVLLNAASLSELVWWNGAATTPTGMVEGGEGIWSLAGGNFTNAAATVSGSWAGSDSMAVFGGTAGTVTIAAGEVLSPAGINFRTDGYVITGADAASGLALDGPTGIDTGEGVGATIAAVMSGSGSLTKTGGGTLTLTANNSFTGLTTVLGGTLVNQGGIAGDIAVASRLTNAGTISGALEVLGGGQATNLTSGTISGGATVQAGGTLVSTGIIAGGLENSGSADVAGVLSGDVLNNGTIRLTGLTTGIGALTQTALGRLELAGFGTTLGRLAGNGAVVLGTGMLTLGGDNSPAAFGGVISGSGGLVKVGTGTFTLSGVNTFTGETRIDAGALTLSAGGELAGAVRNSGTFTNQGTVRGAVVNGGTLNSTGTIGGGLTNLAGATASLAGEVNGAIDNSGSVTLTGATYGITVLAQAASGTFNLGGFGTTVGRLTGAGTINLGSASLTTGGDNTSSTFAGAITGAGGLVKTGTGTLTLSGANTYTGATLVNSGELVVAAGSAVGAVRNAATFTNVGTVTGQLMTFGTATNSGTINGVVRVEAGSFANQSGGTVNGTGFSFGTLANGGTWSGAFLVSAGGSITNNGVWRNTSENASSVADGLFDNTGTLSGLDVIVAGANASLINRAGGMIALDAGRRIFATDGGVVTNLGTVSAIGAANPNAIIVNGTGASWTGDHVVLATGTLINNGTITGSISNSGRFTSDGTVNGSLINRAGSAARLAGAINGDVSNSGAITLTGRTTGINLLSQSVTGSLDLAVFDTNVGLLVGGGSITLGGAAMITGRTGTSSVFSGVISGNGSLVKATSGTLSLTGTNTYTGGTTISGGVLRLGDGGASGSIVGPVVNNATFMIARSDAYTFGGPISGSGMFVQDGTGTTTLTGSNTYAGGTLVARGRLAGSTTSLQGLIRVDAGAVLEFAQASAGTFAGSLMGAGLFEKTGAGLLTLTGNSNGFTGGTSVRGGELRVNGGLAGSVVTVQSGATLSGNGVIGGLIAQSGSTIAPGTSPGTLGVNGNVTLQAGSTIRFEVSASGPSDLILATGSAALGGTADLTNLGGTYAFGSEIVLMQADGGRTGTFAGTTGTAGFGILYRPELVHTGTQVRLRMAANMLGNIAGNTAFTANQRAVLGGIDAAVTAGYNPQPLFAIYSLPTAQIANAFDQLSGEVYATAAGVGIEQERMVREAVLGRLGSTAMASRNAPDTASGLGAWGQLFGGWGDGERNGNAAAFDADRMGFVTGLDYGRANENGSWRAGVFGMRIQSDVTIAARGSAAEVKQSGGGAYAAFTTGGFGAALGGYLAETDLRAFRDISLPGFSETNVGVTEGKARQAFAEVSYTIGSGQAELRPFVSGSVGSFRLDGLTETGGAAALAMARQRYDTATLTGGIDGAVQVGKSLRLGGTLAARHQMGDRDPQASLALAVAPQQAFAVDGVQLDKWALAARLDATLELEENLAISLGYAGLLGETRTDHSARATVQVRF